MAEINMEVILLIIVVALIIFAGAGIFLGTRISSDKRRIKELEGELNDARKDIEVYRSKVNKHFMKTSELFNQMTESYRAVYLHLAEGSQDLCTSDAVLLKPVSEFLKVAHEESKDTLDALDAEQEQAVKEPRINSEQSAQPESTSDAASVQEAVENLEGQEPGTDNEVLTEFVEEGTAEESKPVEESGEKIISGGHQ